MPSRRAVEPVIRAKIHESGSDTGEFGKRGRREELIRVSFVDRLARPGIGDQQTPASPLESGAPENGFDALVEPVRGRLRMIRDEATIVVESGKSEDHQRVDDPTFR